jgi:hypothetical protein
MEQPELLRNSVEEHSTSPEQYTMPTNKFDVVDAFEVKLHWLSTRLAGPSAVTAST